MKKNLVNLSLLFSSFLSANYIYEDNQSLFNLHTNHIATSNNLASGDDRVSTVFDLDFTFSFYGQDFTKARMATNGCLHFGASGGFCNDYTPDPLPEITYTLYPFWTDLIRDNGSKVLAKNFNDKTVFGWYNLREYNRGNTDNSFEVVLWKSDDSFEFRYGGLDIINHDVLIGEQGNTNELYTYFYHDQCGKGTTNSNACVNQTWNNSTINDQLENGGSLYSANSGVFIDCSNPLNDISCSGYWEAFDDQQCDLNPQYAPFCAGYSFQEDVSYFVSEDIDYGFVDEQELMAMGTFVDETEFFVFNDSSPFDVAQDDEIYFEPIFVEDIFVQEEIYLEPLPQINELPIDLIAVSPFAEPIELSMRLEAEFLTEDLIEEDILDELPETTEAVVELQYEEEIEDRIAELEESEIEDVIEIEVEALSVGKIDEKSGITKTQLDVVAQTVSAAANSVSGIKSGNDVHSMGVSGSGQNTSNVIGSLDNLNLNSVSSGIQTFTETGSNTVTASSQSVDIKKNDINNNSMEEFDKSEADTIADNLIAKNLEDQARAEIEDRSTKNQYGNEESIIAYINYVPGYNNYLNIILPKKKDWYQTKVIYENFVIADNTKAFNELFNSNYQKLDKIVKLQPKL